MLAKARQAASTIEILRRRFSRYTNRTGLIDVTRAIFSAALRALVRRVLLCIALLILQLQVFRRAFGSLALLLKMPPGIRFGIL